MRHSLPPKPRSFFLRRESSGHKAGLESKRSASLKHMSRHWEQNQSFGPLRPGNEVAPPLLLPERVPAGLFNCHAAIHRFGKISYYTMTKFPVSG